MFFGLIEFIIIPLAIWYFIFHRRKKLGENEEERRRRHELLNKDAFSECMFLFSIILWGATLYALRQDFNSGVSTQTILLLTSFTGFLLAYRFFLRYTLVVSLIGLLTWWFAQGYLWIESTKIQSLMPLTVKPAAIICGFFFLALLMYIAGRLHEKGRHYKRFSMLYTLIGMFCVTGLLFIFSQKDGLRMFQEMTNGLEVWYSWQMVVLLVLFIAMATVGIWYMWKKKMIHMYETYVLGFLSLLFTAFMFIPQTVLFNDTYRSFDFSSGDRLTGDGFLFALFFNVLLFLFLLGIIFSGYVRKEVWRINLGAVFLFIFIFLKYFDWFFTYLDKSVFFISAGILLFIVGYFMERGRRIMVTATLKTSELTKKTGEK